MLSDKRAPVSGGINLIDMTPCVERETGQRRHRIQRDRGLGRFGMSALALMLVFGPRIHGSWLLDVSSLTPVATLVILLFIRPSLALSRQQAFQLTALILLLLTTLLALLVVPGAEAFWFFKVLRAILVCLGVWSFLKIAREDEGTAGHSSLFGIAVACVLHSCLVLVESAWPSFGLTLAPFVGHQKPDGVLTRFAGLTASFNATALATGIGASVLIRPKLFGAKTRTAHVFSGVGAALCLAAMALMGVTATVAWLLFEVLLGQFQQARLAVAMAVIFLLIVATGILMIRSSSQAIDPPSVMTKLAAIGHFLEYPEDEGLVLSLAQFLYEGAVFPQDWLVATIGFGGSGRDELYVYSDSGWILAAWGVGGVGLSLILAFHGAALVSTREPRHRRPADLASCVWIAFALIIAVSMKEQELLTRHVLPAFLIVSGSFPQRRVLL